MPLFLAAGLGAGVGLGVNVGFVDFVYAKGVYVGLLWSALSTFSFGLVGVKLLPQFEHAKLARLFGCLQLPQTNCEVVVSRVVEFLPALATTLVPQLSQNLEPDSSLLPHSLQNITRLLLACEVNY
jgi:hypothetical protein